VRPITKKVLADYELPPEIIERIEGHARGLLVAGQPGSGKSTFSAAVAEHLHELGRVVKTMEQPRDLQVPKEITQYGALNHDMAKTGEILLLVRPDHVIFDEVRTTDDFRTYADMRLAGVGLFGVSHANRPIDAIQRLIGRVDLGMIPQIVDTVLFIDAGQLTTILELSFTVKVPAGMMEADLARPVVLVRDVMQQKDVYELYTYGEQVVVMPLEGGGLAGPRATPVHSAEDLKRSLGRYARGDLQVEVSGNRAIVYAEEHEIPGLIGKGGRTVQAIEKRLGVRLDIQPMRMAPHRPRGVPSKAPSDPSQPQIRKTGSNIFLLLDKSRGSRMYRVEVEDAVIGEAKASDQGKLRFKLASPEGKAILKAQQAGLDIRCVPI
jgi:ATPase